MRWIVLVGLAACSESPTGAVEMGELTLRYSDASREGKRRSAKAPLAVEVTRDRAAIDAGVDAEVSARIAEIELATSMQRAALLVEQGKMEEAQQELKAAGRKARAQGASLGSAGAGLAGSAKDAEALADELEAAPAAPAARRDLVKRSKSGAYKLKKK